MKQKSRIRTDESRGYTRAGNSIGGHPVGPYLLRYCSTRGYPIRGYPIGCYPIRSYLKIYPITYPLEGYPIKYYPVGGYLKRGYLIKKLSYRTIKGYPSTLPVTPSASPPPTHTPATCNAQKKKKRGHATPRSDRQILPQRRHRSLRNNSNSRRPRTTHAVSHRRIGLGQIAALKSARRWFLEFVELEHPEMDAKALYLQPGSPFP